MEAFFEFLMNLFEQIKNLVFGIIDKANENN